MVHLKGDIPKEMSCPMIKNKPNDLWLFLLSFSTTFSPIYLLAEQRLLAGLYDIVVK